MLVTLPDHPDFYFFVQDIKTCRWHGGARAPASEAPPDAVLPETGGMTVITFRDGTQMETRFHPMQIMSGVQGTGFGADPLQPLPSASSGSQGVDFGAALAAGVQAFAASINQQQPPATTP